MASTKEGLCILCQETQPLCDSHIIPEFCYKPIYDEMHRAYAFSPVTPERVRFAQKGIRSRLLCAKCDNERINEWYEKPFHKFWVEGNALAPLKSASCDRAILRGVPYESFKLFHLSVLLRAAESDHPNFAEIDLGAHLDEVRQMVRSRQAGPDSRYQIVCTAIEGEHGGIWHELIGPAHRWFIGEARPLCFTFCGAWWMYFVDTATPEVDQFCLKESGTLPVLKKPWKEVQRYADAIRRDASS